MTSKVHGKTERFSLLLFVIVILCSLALLFAALALVAPGVWRSQLSASAWAFALAFLGAHLLNSFVEFFFHRYVLHAPAVPFLGYFYRQHTKHHALTRVRLRGTVENLYPILVEEQHEASFFPWYSLAVFALIATPVFALGQWLLPGVPVFLGGYCALGFSLFLYETLHAIEHWSLEKWKPLLESPSYGRFWRIVYGFHLRHHADIHSNESISGFFGFPVPDVVFRTYTRPDSLYEDGKPGETAWFESPRPCSFIRRLDALADEAVRRNRALRAR